MMNRSYLLLLLLLLDIVHIDWEFIFDGDVGLVSTVWVLSLSLCVDCGGLSGLLVLWLLVLWLLVLGCWCLVVVCLVVGFFPLRMSASYF